MAKKNYKTYNSITLK